MKRYIIKTKDEEIYLKKMLLSKNSATSPILTTNKKKAGIFEEDVARNYLKSLEENFDDESRWEKVEV